MENEIVEASLLHHTATADAYLITRRGGLWMEVTTVRKETGASEEGAVV